jgi:MSHA biogenesis protein MshK
MAAHLNRAQQILGYGMFAAAMTLPAVALAENLVDPTQPPGAAGGRSAATMPRPNGGPQLQSVLISPQRRVAVIDGETVRTGDLVGDARVTGIRETEVILRAGNEVRVLRMYPDVEKKSGTGGATAQANKYKQ